MALDMIKASSNVQENSRFESWIILHKQSALKSIFHLFYCDSIVISFFLHFRQNHYFIILKWNTPGVQPYKMYLIKIYSNIYSYCF